MYNGEDIKTAIKSASITDYSQGSVVINEKEITLNAKSYLKRNKIYKDNVWIDTKPLMVENINNENLNDLESN